MPRLCTSSLLALATAFFLWLLPHEAAAQTCFSDSDCADWCLECVGGTCQTRPDGASCFDSNLCGGCLAGVCTVGAATDGTWCDFGNGCTGGPATCQGGVCTSPPIDCSHLDSVCTHGECNGSGQCVAVPKPEGTDCGPIPCYGEAECGPNGTCGGNIFTHPCLDAPGFCMDCTCDETTGETFYQPRPDGSPCATECASGGSCSDGLCVGGTPQGEGSACTDQENFCRTGTCASGQCTNLVGGPRHWSCYEPGCPSIGYCNGSTCEMRGCDDGDPCTTGGTCAPDGSCTGSAPKTCTNAPCVDSTCDPVTGRCDATTPLADGAPCSDLDVCTSGESCQSGQCVGGVDTCECRADADCSSMEDGDRCNGLLRCDPGTHTCELDPATVIVCDTSQDTVCMVNTCDPGSGACSMQPDNDTAACDDGDPCTVDDRCATGSCAGTAMDCSALDAACVVGACDPSVSRCVALPANTGNGCDDANPCTTGDVCDASGGCTATSEVDCSAFDEACSVALCDPASGACSLRVPVNEGGACEDGNACTSGESCQVGACSGGASICECQGDAECAALDDGNPCNGTLVCDLGSHTCAVDPATVIVCGTLDDTVCRKNTCDPATGACSLLPVAAGTVCDDGDPCTGGDACSAGDCLGSSLDCSALDDACVLAVCDGGACLAQAVPDDTPCDDGDPCTGGDACRAGACEPATTDECGSDTAVPVDSVEVVEAPDAMELPDVMEPPADVADASDAAPTDTSPLADASDVATGIEPDTDPPSPMTPAGGNDDDDGLCSAVPRRRPPGPAGRALALWLAALVALRHRRRRGPREARAPEA